MAPPVWAMNASIYIWHRETLSRGLWSGRARLYEMPHNRSVDIDSEIDFRLVEEEGTGGLPPMPERGKPAKRVKQTY